MLVHAMRDDDLAELAEQIAQAWARGSGRSETQRQTAVASIFMTLREIHDHGHQLNAAFAEKPEQKQRMKLVCCPHCERVMRDNSALGRHIKFCTYNLRNVRIK
ncbi:hypothetical protein CU669_04890 [Paramagnetospirillum kuznetsovii]|uniref:Uncharacterized protein n=1 Tax=Paramagnetospirillum kuznetsovii TaxID=2053833 RepID=A0A364P2H3_9PROT|nr:hypothetical protein CU669_04890 [Paramagnetospirillum kuznetsovii]